MTDQPIRQALAAYQSTVLAKDVDAFVAIYAEDAQVFELWGTWMHDIASWREMAKGWFAFLGDQRSVVEAHDVRTQVSGDMALLTASNRPLRSPFGRRQAGTATQLLIDVD